MAEETTIKTDATPEQAQATEQQMLKELNVYRTLEFAVERENFTYRFFMTQGAPLGEAYDACFEVLQRITDLSVITSKQAQRIKENEKKEASKEA